ncbi:MAG: aspartate aminotransferase family protein [Pararhodobacter sp.]|nr:aspartate aminotransferase family protein [Pararhodobacter sp.]
MTHLLHRTIHTDLPVVASGHGSYLTDSEGRSYLDASGGAAVSCIGHGHPRVRAAVIEQMDKIAYAHTSFFTTQAAEDLAELLVRGAPAGISHAYVLNGGSEAVEAALKMARQYFIEQGQPARRHIIARHQSYHGNTLGALATGGNKRRREQFMPLLIETHHIDPCYAYRHQRPDETEEDYGLRAAQQLEDKILELGPDTVIAFVAETVVGATSGAVPPARGYFGHIREICDRYGVLLILDEVMCGMGRTGTLHACEQEGISADIEIVAKGLAGGYQPVSAVLVSDTVFQAFSAGSGAFQHGHTYMGHPVGARVALEVQRIIAEEDLLENVRRTGAYLMLALKARFGNMPEIGDIRGRGLLIGLELVRDRVTKEPFDPALTLHARIKRAAMTEGLLVYPGGGTVDGVSGDHVLLAPPFTINHAEADLIAERLGRAIETSLAQVE